MEAVEIPYIMAILECTAGVKHVLQRSGLYKPELQLCTKDVFTTKDNSKPTKLEPSRISICYFVSWVVERTIRYDTYTWPGPVQLNGIGRMHVKAPLAAANGHEWFRSKATKSDVFDFWLVKARPQHRELLALLFMNSVWVLQCPIVICNKGNEKDPPAYTVILIREDLKV